MTVRTLRAPLAAAMLVLSGLGGCYSLAPRYQRPSGAIPPAWPQRVIGADGPAADAPGVDATGLPWRDFVLDARLRQVIQIALDNSRDLRQSILAVEAARALYRVQRSNQLPAIDANVSGARMRSLAAGADNGTTVVSESWSATLGLSAFEIDLFGRLHSQSKAALESYLSSAEMARAARISLIAETAGAWFALAADRSLLGVARDTQASAQRSMQVTRKRLDAGIASAVDVHQAETVYQQSRSDVARYTTLVEQDRNALELLSGHGIDDELLPDGLADGAQWLTEVPAGLRSDVLLQRPDVLAAEHTLRSKNFSVGAARASFFPNISLTAASGLASGSLSSLFSDGAKIWSVRPSASLPLFAGGAKFANLSYAKSGRAAAVANYELTLQTAFKEVADALARRGTLRELLDAQQALVQAAAGSYRLAQARYEKGADSFLNALDSQRTLYGAQQSLIGTRLTALDNAVSLYRALGGGLGSTPDAQAVR